MAKTSTAFDTVLYDLLGPERNRQYGDMMKTIERLVICLLLTESNRRLYRKRADLDDAALVVRTQTDLPTT